MATLYKRNGSPYWWVYYRASAESIRESTGVRHEGRAKPCSTAQEVRRVIEDRVLRARWNLSPTILPTSIEKFLAEHGRNLSVAPRTKEVAINCHNQFVSWCKAQGVTLLHDVTRAVTQRWAAHRRAEGVAESTLALQFRTLGRAWSEARAMKYVDYIESENPWAVTFKVVVEEKTPFTEEEIAKLFAGEADRWVHLAMRIALGTGARIGSIMALRWEDIDLDQRVITFTQSKTGRYSTPIPDELVRHLQTLAKVDGPMFANVTNKSLSYPSKVFGDYCRLTIGRVANWHHFRHTYVTRLQVAGVPERVAKELVNHSSTAIHRAYAHARAKDLLPFLGGVSLFPKQPPVAVDVAV